MSQETFAVQGADEVLDRMLFNETVEIELEFKKKTLAAERRHLEWERQALKNDRRAFDRLREMEQKRMEADRRLFEMKWKVLEEETRKLADERAYVERQKQFYEKVKQSLAEVDSQTVVSGDMFFTGVSDEVALKRRYRDLLKIYHPDNVNGDTETIQEINREYNYLRQKFA